MTINATIKTPEQVLSTQGSTWVIRLLYVLGALFVIAVLSFNIFQPIKVLPRVSLAPGFVFANQDGISKTSEDFRGKLTIYSFTYAGCSASCPQTTQQMQALKSALARLPAQDVKYALVTISLDPDHDTPDMWQKYAAPFLAGDASNVSWDFLSGDTTRTRYVVGGGFSVYYKNLPSQANSSASITFEPRYVLVDGWGIIRAEYRGAELDISRVIRDVGYLQSEIRNSQGVARYAYEAAHLFRCYP
jgi:protein SCO1/2